MDKVTITAVREAIKGDALTDDVKSKIGEIEAYFESTSEMQSKIEALQKDNDKLQIKMMAEKGRRESAEDVIEDFKAMNNESEKLKSDYEKMKADFEAMKSENESLQVIKREQDEQLRTGYMTELEGVMNTEAFEKWKDEFVVPGDDLKLEDIAIDELKASKERLSKLKERGVFGAVDSKVTGGEPDNTEIDTSEELEILQNAGVPIPKF